MHLCNEMRKLLPNRHVDDCAFTAVLQAIYAAYCTPLMP